MKITRQIKKLTNAADCGDLITMDALASPLLNLEHTHRVPLFKNKKECGTTMPLVLFAGLKLKYLSECEADKERDDTDSEIQHFLRVLLANIYNTLEDAGANPSDYLVAKTLQRVVFRHIVWGEPLYIETVDEVLLNTKRNRVHTVADNLSPSTTIPGFLCEWVLEKNKLNGDAPLKHVNNDIKAISRDVYSILKAYPNDAWKPVGSFSRRVQNTLMLQAFREAMTVSDFVRPIKNPAL
jgi:uncharacterized protein (UPF0297 family)